MFLSLFLKKKIKNPGVAQWSEGRLEHQRVTGSISACWGECRRQPIDVSHIDVSLFPIFPSLPFSKTQWKNILGWEFKKGYGMPFEEAVSALTTYAYCKSSVRHYFLSQKSNGLSEHCLSLTKRKQRCSKCSGKSWDWQDKCLILVKDEHCAVSHDAFPICAHLLVIISWYCMSGRACKSYNGFIKYQWAIQRWLISPEKPMNE